MHRQRTLFSRLRCQHSQTRSAATAAKLKTPGRASDYSEQLSIPKKRSPWSPTDKMPSAKSWGRPSDFNDVAHSRSPERQPSRFPRPPPRHDQAWSPSSLSSKSSVIRNQKQIRGTNGRDEPQTPQTIFERTRPPRGRGSGVDGGTAKVEHTQATHSYSPGITHFQESNQDSRRDPARARTRSDPYKTRGSIVEKLGRGEQDIIRKSQQRNPVRKPTAHTPRLKAKPRMDVYIPSVVTVGTLARILNVKFDRLIRKMVEAGMADDASHDHVLTSDYAVLLAEDLGRNPIVDDEAAFDLYPPAPHPDLSSLPSRPPIITIMGHVDHGKTTLLDTLRSSAVAKGEAGGITQHIGAFSVPVESSQGQQFITFLDTPGHAAFSAMRARGAGITDIVVLVVAADDGIMPQTREVIGLLQKGNGKVGLVVAINKVDKPEADVEAVKLALMSEGIQLECFGGDVPSVEVSGLTGQGLSELVETVSVMAELRDLRSEKEGSVHGYVLESKMTRGLGPVATVLVLRGCLHTGSHILSSAHTAKVRLMTDSAGKSVKAAYPGMAITVSGWKTLPNAGDEVLDGKESEVKKALANRIRQAEIAASLADVDAINATRKEERERRKAETDQDKITPENDSIKELKLIIKADVSGSAEAVGGALQGIGNKEAVTKIISSGVGDVTESDVLMAKAVDATVVAFSVSVPRSVEILAAQNAVPITTSAIIYRLMEDVTQRVIALLPTIKETKVTGEATVIQLFDIQLKAKQLKKIAGCRVINGIVEKAKSARIVRDGSVIHEGALDTMRILKKDVTEVRKGSECGLSLIDFADLREGDLVQMHQTIEKPGVL